MAPINNRSLERLLKRAGYNPGTVDKTPTAKTQQALAQFEAAVGLPADGLADADSFKALAKVERRRAAHKGDTFFGVGQKDDRIAQAQRRLAVLGYAAGPADGVFDAEVAKAVEAFKKDQGFKKDLPALGDASLKQLRNEVQGLDHHAYRGRVTHGVKRHRRLDRATADAAAREPLGPGSSQRAVKNVQTHLKAAGFDPKRTDGTFDERTEAALKAFQRKSGLPDNGRVGPGTWKKLQAATFTAKDGTSPAQRLGEKSAAVQRSETLLRKLGHRGVKADGIFDRATLKASRAFEKRFPGMGTNGQIGAGQLRRMKQVLRAKRDPGSGPLLKKGYRGAPVRTLERRLHSMGFLHGKVDGQFTDATRTAVKRFQRAFALEADGVVGKHTWRMLAVDARGKVNKPGAGGSLSAGGGWGGTQNVANLAKSIAGRMGIPVTSQKRDLATTIAVGSSTSSDHYTGNTNAFAVDFGVSGSRGDQLARSIARAYGIPSGNIGTFNRHTITVDGQRFSLQLLWRVDGHFDHVHLGIQRV